MLHDLSEFGPLTHTLHTKEDSQCQDPTWRRDVNNVNTTTTTLDDENPLNEDASSN